MEIKHIKNLKSLDYSHLDQILRLAKRNNVELMNRPIKKSHAMFGLTSAWMLADIGLQLDPVTSKTLNSELLLTLTEDSRVIGFLTFTRAIDCPTACGINYICVDSKHRNQGIMKSMITKVKSEYTDISLACFPDLVEMYERLGFTMHEAHGAQVSMRIGDTYEMNKIKPGILAKHPDVMFESELLIREYGPKKAKKINEKFDAETLLINEKVVTFVQNRLVRN